MGKWLQLVVRQPLKAEFLHLEIFDSLPEAKVLGAEHERFWNKEQLNSRIVHETLGADLDTLCPPQFHHHHDLKLCAHWHINRGQGRSFRENR
jgi:hypothetical protein